MTGTAKADSAVLAIDQGTTGTKALLLAPTFEVLAEGEAEFPQHFPQPGWVEHEPEEIFSSVRSAVLLALERAQFPAERISAIGITNQRETTVLWSREDGRPVHRAIVWQDRRTADLCRTLRGRGLESTFRERTGLLLDPYFSATKIVWILENVKGAKAEAQAGRLAFGTIDTYLTWRLTGGASHVTDVSNASRTLLMDLERLEWAEDLVSVLEIPPSLLPRIAANDEECGRTRGLDFLPDGIPILALLGDQQAALFGQACHQPGDTKCTYGTGAFAIANTGEKIARSRSGLLSTAAWKLGGKPTYALEGSCFVAGAVVQWLRDGLGIISSSDEIEALASSVESSEGVVFVPALTGLGAPHWMPLARGVIGGITRGTRAAHIARAALEGIAFQVHDLVRALEKDLGEPIRQLRVDGGASRNELLMQFQADILGVDVVRPRITSTTALGVGLLAGLNAGLFPSLEALARSYEEEKRFRPKLKKREVAEHLNRWITGLRQARVGAGD